MLLPFLLFFLSLNASAQEDVKKEFDFEVKGGLEIIGAEERPRVMFFLPPLEIPYKELKIDKGYLLKNDLIELDLKRLISEEVKDVRNNR